MARRYTFGLCQEDERTEAEALGLPGGRVLGIAGAGDMPLSLLALGAERVTAVDADPRQLHLARLKAGAVGRLEREEAAALLGFLPAAREERLQLLARALEGAPSATHSYWGQNRAALDGIVGSGRFERYLRALKRVFGPLLAPRFRELLACETLAAQREVFARRFEGPLLRVVFNLAFHDRLFGAFGMDRRSLRHRDPGHHLGTRYRERFRLLCTGTPVRENYFLRVYLFLAPALVPALPAYLTPAGFAAARPRLAKLDFVESNLSHFVRGCRPGAFDRFHLSNVSDWMERPEFEELMRAVARATAGPARLVRREIHSRRSLPEDLAGTIAEDRPWGERLRQTDRFPFYDVVPGVIGRK